MAEDIKAKIYRLVDAIEDESILQMVAEDISYYTADKDMIDDLNEDQKQELNDAICEADNNETIDWKDFVNEMNEWKKR